jgi:hypothetical protein
MPPGAMRKSNGWRLAATVRLKAPSKLLISRRPPGAPVNNRRAGCHPDAILPHRPAAPQPKNGGHNQYAGFSRWSIGVEMSPDAARTCACATKIAAFQAPAGVDGARFPYGCTFRSGSHR